MLNEGIVITSTTNALKSEMVLQIRRLGEATADQWERAVFESLTGQSREDVDWEFEDNQAGYFTWLKSFDHHVGELLEDGFVRTSEKAGAKLFRPVETDPEIDWSPLVAPSR